MALWLCISKLCKLRLRVFTAPADFLYFFIMAFHSLWAYSANHWLTKKTEWWFTRSNDKKLPLLYTIFFRCFLYLLLKEEANVIYSNLVYIIVSLWYSFRLAGVSEERYDLQSSWNARILLYGFRSSIYIILNVSTYILRNFVYAYTMWCEV